MPRTPHFQGDLGLDPMPAPVPAPERGLVISASATKPLSPAQEEFNRRMKALEKARAAYARKQAKLDKILDTCASKVLPLIEEINRANRDLAFEATEVRRTLKLTPKRKHWLGDLISNKASDLLADPMGLSEADIERLETLVEELGPCLSEEEVKAQQQAEFDVLRSMVEGCARHVGADIDLSDMDIHGDPEEFQRELNARLDALDAVDEAGPNAAQNAPTRNRKPSKAARERERRQRELEEAKTRDFKSLYKQLAKVLHPDLESDPVLKEHKEAWMKRLTTAHANGDLRDMLEIEMEWLGEEAGNLANASDEKLKVYSLVLKEQTDELKLKTMELALEPQYQTLRRFLDPYTLHMPAIYRIILELMDELRRLQVMLRILRAGGEKMRKMIYGWADENARASNSHPFF